MLEMAFLSLLRKRPETLIRAYERTAVRPVEITEEGKPVTFPDLVLLLNSAADSIVAKGIIATLKKKQVHKKCASPNVDFLPTLLISATSSRERLIPLSQVNQNLGLAGLIGNGAGFDFFGRS